MEQSILLRRESKRAYLDRPVPDEVLNRILEKTRWAPSCSNNQPWRFIVVREPEALERLHQALNRGNAWAKRAPVLIVATARESDDYVRTDDPVSYHLFDTGLAVENLLLAAVEEGLMAHPMAGYKAPIVKEALGIPPDYSVICLISLGYPGGIDTLDERTRQKDLAPRTRKPIEEIVSFDRWAFPSPTEPAT